MEKNLVDIQTELFLTQRYVKVRKTNSTNEIIEKILEYSKKHHTFLLFLYIEIFFDSNQLKKISNCINSLPNKIWIMSSTATKNPLYVEPIVNFLAWKDNLIDDAIDRNLYSITFPPKMWKNREYSLKTKEIKSILSLRRHNIQRDMLYERVKDIDISIKRYYYKEPNKHYPVWNELIDEYLKTFVNFVSETTYPSSTETTCVTEKSILSFLCGNIPIILGKKNLVKELEDMGFWIANKEFGYDDYADSLDDFSDEKIDLFVKCIENVNKTDIKKFYIQNIEKINNNHKIIKESFSKKYTI